jgi:hypothetical protein
VPDFPPGDDICGALEEHVRRSFPGQVVESLGWDRGPIVETNPHFHVLQVAPNTDHPLWAYVSIGGWNSAGEAGREMEFILAAPAKTERAVELLAMAVYYNRNGRLGLGHTCPIGEPWLSGSQCDHVLVSVPYPFPPSIETAHVGDRHVEFLWLLPITESERDFKVRRGLEALESRFDEAAIDYADPHRPSVV